MTPAHQVQFIDSLHIITVQLTAIAGLLFAIVLAIRNKR
jgi:hypothetical protein